MPTIFIALLLLLAPFAAAQTEEQKAADYEYTGEPIRLSLDCSNDDMAMFGLVCSAERPCPVYLELTSVDFMKGRLAVVGNLHGESNTMYSVLLVSEDGGLSWSEPFERLPHSGLDKVHFHDDTHGWAQGHVLDGGPHDPFFLLTTDGGKIWRRRSVFDDERSVVIERFWFDSDRSGGLLVDRLREGENGARYERYETMTGAESWMIREVSTTPIRVRRTRMQVRNDWRVIADEKTGAWQIQKEGDTGWNTISEFQIETGLCVARDEDIAAAPTPPEPEEEAVGADGKAPLPDELPTAPGGVFVIGAPTAPQQPTEIEVEDDPDRPRTERPKP
jgi:hypothetical protein